MSLIKSGGEPASEPDIAGRDVAGHLQQFAHTRGGSLPAYLEALARLCDAQHTLAWWAGRYLAVRVAGGSPNTLAARTRDLTAFIRWFVTTYGHGDITRWHVQATRSWLRRLGDANYAPTSINRALSSLKHFSRWAQEQPAQLFAKHGPPTAGVRDLLVDEADCKKLSDTEVQALFWAAGRAIRGAGHPAGRPLRDQALLGLLYYTGLRISEVVALRRDQYDGEHLTQVSRKGRSRTRLVYLCRPCRRHLDAYLEQEWAADANLDTSLADDGCKSLFVSAKSGKALDRRRIARLLQRLAQQASTAEQTISVHPHRLRHTFGALYREASGSDAETAAALGHAGLQYVGRYTRKSQSERYNLLESMFAEDTHNSDADDDDTGGEETPS